VLVLVVGGASWDTIVHVDHLPEPRAHTVFAKESYETVGSTGAGKALNLARLGHDVHLHTLIGDDEVGQQALDSLAGSGVVVHPEVTARPTERHVNLMA
jgi:acarbose 7IV-phosphotransferase